MRDDIDYSYAAIELDIVDFHGFDMDAPIHIPAGACASTWHDQFVFQQSVVR